MKVNIQSNTIKRLYLVSSICWIVITWVRDLWLLKHYNNFWLSRFWMQWWKSIFCSVLDKVQWYRRKWQLSLQGKFKHVQLQPLDVNGFLWRLQLLQFCVKWRWESTSCFSERLRTNTCFHWDYSVADSLSKWNFHWSILQFRGQSCGE